MSHQTLTSGHSIDSCTLHLQSWKPFTLNPNPNPKTLDPDSHTKSKRPCLSDRATSFSISVDALDISRLTLFDDDEKPLSKKDHHHRQLRWMPRKRRRRGSRSVSGRSCCSVAATATATCSDFMVAAAGTDSSGELFGNGNGEANWSSDVSDARTSRTEKGERDNVGPGLGFEALATESGYGSEPGYRGDAEFGCEDEVDEEEEDDARFLLWGERFGDLKMEVVGENTFAEQKMHCRGRRRKNDLKTCESVR